MPIGGGLYFFSYWLGFTYPTQEISKALSFQTTNIKKKGRQTGASREGLSFNKTVRHEEQKIGVKKRGAVTGSPF